MDRRKGARGTRTHTEPRLRAAAQFLKNIPMGNGLGEHAHRGGEPPRQGAGLHPELGAFPSAVEEPAAKRRAVQPSPSPALTDAPLDDLAGAVDDVAVRLRGMPFRHVTSRGHRSSKLFQDALLRDGALDGRIAMSRAKAYPSVLFSLIKYDAAAENAYHSGRQVSGGGARRGG